MKAIRVHQFGGPEVPQVEEVQSAPPGPGAILIRVRAAGVNPYDRYVRSGAYGARNPALPYTPGSDAAGTIEALGPDANRFKTGDRVFTTGTVTGACAELALCSVEQVLQKLPEGVSYFAGRGPLRSIRYRVSLAFPTRACHQAGLRDASLRPVIAYEMPLASAPEAYSRVMETSCVRKDCADPVNPQKG